jgi:ribose transport system substrate-binding protein
LLTKAHQFYKDLEAAMLEEARAQGVTLKIQSAEMNAADQQKQVQTMLSQKVDAIILCPVDSQSSGSTVSLANDANVPVFTADIASKAGRVVCHVASNNEQGGELVGDYLAKKLGGKGEIGIIDFPLVTSVQDRVRGFEKAIAKYPGIKIVAKLAPDQALRAKAFPIAQDMLQAHPALSAIFGINDDCALGALQAATGASRANLIIVGFDGIPEAAENIRKGTPLKADAVQHPRVIGKAVVDAVVRHSLGEPVPASVPIPTGLVHRKE